MRSMRVIDWYGGALVSRLNDKQKGSIIAVMQRSSAPAKLMAALPRDWIVSEDAVIDSILYILYVGPAALHRRRNL